MIIVKCVLKSVISTLRSAGTFVFQGCFFLFLNTSLMQLGHIISDVTWVTEFLCVRGMKPKWGRGSTSEVAVTKCLIKVCLRKKKKKDVSSEFRGATGQRCDTFYPFHPLYWRLQPKTNSPSTYTILDLIRLWKKAFYSTFLTQNDDAKVNLLSVCLELGLVRYTILHAVFYVVCHH